MKSKFRDFNKGVRMVRNLVCCVWLVMLLAGTTVAGQWVGFGQSNSFYEDGYPSYVPGRDGKLFFSGHDLFAGGFFVKNIAVWDGVGWRDTTTGIPGNSIRSVFLNKEGHLMVCTVTPVGTSQNAVEKSCLMRWDGVQWNTAAAGLYNAYSVTADTSGTFYASVSIDGNFLHQNAVVKYNGHSWDTLGKPFNSYVESIRFDQHGNLWASGCFDSVGNVAAAGVARWDGSVWQPMSEGLVALEAGKKISVNKLLQGKGTVYALGEFYTTTLNTLRGIAQWDGAKWCSVGDLEFYTINSMENDYLGNLYVSGKVKDNQGSYHSVVAVWNGTQWTQLGRIDQGPEKLIIDYSGHVYGYGLPYDGLVVWRNDMWQPVVTDNGIAGGINSIFADTLQGYVYVSGMFSTAGGTFANSVARWDGQKWQACGNGFEGEVSAITGNANGDIFVSARLYYTDTRVLVRFSKGKWDTIGHLNYSRECNTLSFDASGMLYAGGTFDSIDGIPASRIACWNGSVWKALGTGISGNEVRSIVFDKAGKLYAGGTFDIAGGNVAHNIAMWDGTSWQALGDGIKSELSSFDPVTSVVVDLQGNVYAGGTFSQAGTVAANNIARWDGSTWHPIAEGICTDGSGISALAINSEGRIFAGGRYLKCIGTTAVTGIAQWDGIQWSALDQGISWHNATPGTIQALYCDKNTLHVGGYFEYAGKYASSSYAQYRFDQTATHTQQKAAPAQSGISFDKQHIAFRLHLATDTRVNVSITNLMGKVLSSTNVKMSSGDHQVPVASKALPCGVYVVHVKAGSEMSSYRYVVER
jgi:hypothetical protein